ncbi:BspA family leucine-rich repeat surface protein [Winogradskyella sp. 3972H.M.0a.05]|uniref:BspA family leucine-rich repeat surface protein n=1 Tax=Winogradskyella sp. 3972H.M.0a.05 TaxID=2950277 RepID=UPI0033959689
MKTVLQYGLMVLIFLSGISKGNTQCGAGDTIIQNQANTASIAALGYGQSFTSTCTGQIDRFRVWVDTAPSVPTGSEVDVSIYQGAVSSGGATLLQTFSTDFPSIGSNTIILSSPINVTLGEVYTFTIEDTEIIRYESFSGSPPYSDGSAQRFTGSNWISESDEDLRFEVGYVDSEPPVAVCQDFTANLDASGNYIVQISDIDGGSTDDTGITSYSVEPPMLTCDNLAGAIVELTVRDDAGNQSSCMANVTLIDNNDACIDFFDDAFVTTWATDNNGPSGDNQITIPTNNSATYSYAVDWGDGNIQTNITGDVTHTYASSGTYTVKIKGEFPQLYFANSGDLQKILSVEEWGSNAWASMNQAFRGCTNLVINATDTPDLSNVVDMSRMFQNTNIDAGLNAWDVSNVESFAFMFANNPSFNEDITSWNIGAALDMERMFLNATSFNQNLGSWNVSNVANFQLMLENSGLSSYNYGLILIGWSTLPGLLENQTFSVGTVPYCLGEEEHDFLTETVANGGKGWTITDGGLNCSDAFITTWKTDNPGVDHDLAIRIETTGPGYNYAVDWGDGNISTGHTGSFIYSYAEIGTYTVKIIGDFPRIHFGANDSKEKLVSVEQWGTNSWTSMERAFSGCTNMTLNATDIPDLSNVTEMSFMFFNASSFNGDLSAWDVSNVTNMRSMFQGASSFNSDIGNWNVSNVANMRSMFHDAVAFDQDLGAWNVSNVTNMAAMFSGAELFVDHYDALLNGWANLSLQNNVTFNAGNSMYCAGAAARQQIIDDFGWQIFDDGEDCSDPFENGLITTWNTNLGTSTQTISIMIDENLTYSYNIDWGDGQRDLNVTGHIDHVYDALGTYQIKIIGVFPAARFGDGFSTNNAQKLQSVDQWGNIQWETMNSAFSDCQNMNVLATDAPDLSNVTNMRRMFEGASSLNADLNHWDVSNVTNMSELFNYATNFNGEIGNWNVSNVTNMDQMFDAARNFNKNINSWNVGNVTSMRSMFYEAEDFNQELGNWNVSSVTDMTEMFGLALKFNQDIGAWDVSNVTTMQFMFSYARDFDQNIGDWNVSSVNNFGNMFNNSGLSIDNYDALLMGWSSLPSLMPNENFDAGDSKYCAAIAERQYIIDTYGWTINDQGQECNIEQFDNGFITTWETTTPNEVIIIPVSPSDTYDYHIDWGDGNTTFNRTGIALHIYANPGIHTVRIIGQFPRILMANTTPENRAKLKSVEQWGNVRWQSMEAAFFFCQNLVVNATDAPNLRWATSLNSMFAAATSVNSDFNNWDVSTITDMASMFSGSSAFDQDLSAWDISALTDATSMFGGVTLSIENYDALLLGWSTLDEGETQIPVGITFSAGDSKYCFGQPARTILTSAPFNWAISDDGADCGTNFDDGFITTWKTDNSGTSGNTQITIPTFSQNTYNYSVDWGDGNYSFNLTEDYTHTYDSAGTYTVKIIGEFPFILFNNQGDKDKILSVEQWGNIEWFNMQFAFRGCSNLLLNATDAPNLSNATSMFGIFQDAVLVNGDLNHWDVSSITNMGEAFKGALAFNGNVSSWDVSSVEDMQQMFENATTFNQDLGAWDISSITNMTNMFVNVTLSTDHYDSLLRGWSILDVDSGETQIPSSISFHGGNSISCFDQNGKVNLQSIHNWTITDGGTCSADQFVTTWKTDQPGGSTSDNQILIDTQGSGLDFDIDWGDGNVDIGVTGDITHTYAVPGTYTIRILGDFRIIGTSSNDADKLLTIEQWGSMQWTSMQAAFRHCDNVIVNATDTPDLSQTDNTSFMFLNALSMTGDLSAWNVSTITNMEGMFQNAGAFNSDISNWNVSNVTTMSSMFRNAIAFQQNLENWDITNITTMENMFTGVSISTPNYDATLIGWQNDSSGSDGDGIDDVPSNIIFGGGNSIYCFSEIEHQNLTDTFNWTITDGGFCSDTDFFITTWKTDNPGSSDNNQITIPTVSGQTYSYIVEWGDGNSDTNVTGDITHTYATPGTYEVRIIGDFPRIRFNDDGDDRKILSVEQWGTIMWQNMEDAFRGCENLVINATDAPDLSNATSLQAMFRGCTSMNNNINHWDTSTITDMKSMFRDATGFNQPLNLWNVSNVTDIERMFQGATVFNQPLNDWDVSSVTTMERVFWEATDFNQPLNLWDVSNVTTMEALFFEAYAFNQDLSSWNVSNVTNMDSTFQDAEAFNQDLSGWNVSNVTNMDEMFLGALVFNQPLNSWDVSNVTIIGGMFQQAEAFNQDLNNWDTSSITVMEDVFQQATAFNGDITTWDTSNVTDFRDMFYQATSFNRDIGNWNTGSATTMSSMFESAMSFNQDLSSWNTSSVTSMFSMFENAVSFNQDIGGWDTSSVVNTTDMFRDAIAFNQDIGNWDLSSIDEHMHDMFLGAGLSTDNYDATLIGWHTDESGAAGDSDDDVPFNVDFHGGNSQYCNSEVERQDLIDTHGWTIIDDGFFCPGVSFITTWETTTANETITIPTLPSGTYNYTVDWGDGNITTNETGDATHQYTTPGIHAVSITGDFPSIYFNNSGDKDKILTVQQWGIISWETMSRAFLGCTNLDVVATDIPDLSNVSSLAQMFQSCNTLVGTVDFNNWDTSTVNDISSIFEGASNFNQPIGNWNVSNVLNMRGAFRSANDFNQDISSWNVGNVTNMREMFRGALDFNQDITNWDVSSVQTFASMFSTANAFNQDIGDWDIGAATSISQMFRNTVNFNQDLGDWDISDITTMENMFNGAALSTANYDATLIGWHTDESGLAGDGDDDVPSNIVFHGGNSNYCNAEPQWISLDTTYNWTITDGGLDCSFVLVNPIVYLQGASLNPNIGEETLMRDDIRLSGYVPTISPYGDGLTMNGSVLANTGPDAIVDWVWVELRDGSSNTTIIDNRSALLQRDGDVVDVDGTSPVDFVQSPGIYYIAVKHRNHLGIMSASTIALNGTTTVVDFTDGSVATFGTNAQTTFGMPLGIQGMWAGDANGDGKVNIIGAPNDANTIRDAILNDPINQIIQFYGFTVSGYTNEDVNLTGGANIIGANNDANVLRDDVLNHPINQFLQFYGYNILEQLPAVVPSARMAFDIEMTERNKQQNNN